MEQATKEFVGPVLPHRDKLKRKLVNKARSAIPSIQELSLKCEESKGFRYYASKHQTIREAVVTLWGLGFWTDQIATFIGNGITEAIVLQALRGHLSQHQQELFGLITQTEPCALLLN